MEYKCLMTFIPRGQTMINGILRQEQFIQNENIRIIHKFSITI